MIYGKNISSIANTHVGTSMSKRSKNIPLTARARGKLKFFKQIDAFKFDRNIEDTFLSGEQTCRLSRDIKPYLASHKSS